jgi:hypothetical protein
VFVLFVIGIAAFGVALISQSGKIAIVHAPLGYRHIVTQDSEDLVEVLRFWHTHREEPFQE